MAVVAAAAAAASDKFQHLETGSSHSARSAGRKSSAPKKLRLSSTGGGGDTEVEEIGSGAAPRPWPLITALSATLQEGTGVLGRNGTVSPCDEDEGRISSEGEGDSEDVVAVSGVVPKEEMEEEGAARSDDSDSIIMDADQPVDFSATASSGGRKHANSLGMERAAAAPRYSILGSYLKSPAPAATGRSFSMEEEDEEQRRHCHHQQLPQLLRHPSSHHHHTTAAFQAVLRIRIRDPGLGAF